MKRTIVIIGIVMLCTGCSLLQTEVGPTVAKQINRYCREPLATRVLLRTEINAMIQPNRIELQCAGDTN